MSVQARFFVQTITRHAAHDGVQVSLAASGRGKENKSWSQYTPSGKLELTINNPSAAQWFLDRLGKDIALTFEDRPVVCPKCHEEVDPRLSGEHQVLTHVVCPNCQDAFNPGLT